MPNNKRRSALPVPMSTSQLKKATVDPNAKMFLKQEDPPGTLYRCTCCGKFYNTQAANFQQSSSPLYKGNNGYITICRSCLKQYFEYLMTYFNGDEQLALERICQMFDVYYHPTCVERSSGEAKDQQALLQKYLTKIKTKTFSDSGATYLDTVRDYANNAQKKKKYHTAEVRFSDDEDETSAPAEDVHVDERRQKQIAFWGPGFQDEEYDFLDGHYEYLRAMTDGNDPMQDIYLRDLATTKVFQNRATFSGDSDTFNKMKESYQKTAEKAHLVVKQVADVSTKDATWGTFIDMVEHYCPAEYYQDKKLFADFDGIEDYFKRFIVRPFKNFLTGSRELDDEFSIREDEVNET